MPEEITIKHNGGKDSKAVEVRTTREPFSPHLTLNPGEERTITVEDSNQVTFAIQGVMEAPSMSPFTEPTLEDEKSLSPSEKAAQDNGNLQELKQENADANAAANESGIVEAPKDAAPTTEGVEANTGEAGETEVKPKAKRS